MRLLSLEVANYRNIAAAQLEPGRELTVICGNNGQGKNEPAGGHLAADRRQKLPGRQGCRACAPRRNIRGAGSRHPAHPAGGSGTGRTGQCAHHGGHAGCTAPRPVCIGERCTAQAGGRPCGQFSGCGVRPRAPEPCQRGTGRTAAVSGRGAVPAVPRLPCHLPPLCAGIAAEKRASASFRRRHGAPVGRKNAPCWKC